MSEIKRCTECKTIKSAKFRQLKGNKWKEAENNNLAKVMWTEGVVLCNICYMNFVGNLLKREPRRVKTTDAEGEEEEVSKKIDFTRAIKVLYMILMKYKEIEPSLKGFLTNSI